MRVPMYTNERRKRVLEQEHNLHVGDAHPPTVKEIPLGRHKPAEKHPKTWPFHFCRVRNVLCKISKTVCGVSFQRFDKAMSSERVCLRGYMNPVLYTPSAFYTWSCSRLPSFPRLPPCLFPLLQVMNRIELRWIMVEGCMMCVGERESECLGSPSLPPSSPLRLHLFLFLSWPLSSLSTSSSSASRSVPWALFFGSLANLFFFLLFTFVTGLSGWIEDPLAFSVVCGRHRSKERKSWREWVSASFWVALSSCQSRPLPPFQLWAYYCTSWHSTHIHTHSTHILLYSTAYGVELRFFRIWIWATPNKRRMLVHGYKDTTTLERGPNLEYGDGGYSIVVGGGVLEKNFVHAQCVRTTLLCV